MPFSQSLKGQSGLFDTDPKLVIPVLPQFFRSAKLFLVGDESHIVLDSSREQETLRPLIEKLNGEHIAVPWLNGVVLRFFIAEEQSLHPLTTSEKRKKESLNASLNIPWI